MKIKLLGLTGLAGCGKDTIARIMSENSTNIELYALADPLKKAASSIFNIPLDSFYNQNLKEMVEPYWDLSPREMLQKLGTEACRNVFGEDIWLKSGESYIKDLLNKGKTVIVTDIRFDNEAQWIKDNGGIIIEIQRDNLKKQEKHNHSSEQGISIEKFILKNNGTLENLKEDLLNTIKLLELQ